LVVNYLLLHLLIARRSLQAITITAQRELTAHRFATKLGVAVTAAARE